MTTAPETNVLSSVNLARIEAEAHAMRAEAIKALVAKSANRVARLWAALTHGTAHHAA
ncbi:RSP_7527 family protein [Pseudogemmobacter sp. W21_MBD1_M6]|uniref:RSP_7527 family protein n=1 Tax=Pseudogemmobacter sp. W21_MBD1_M6 TaxID=3240271 RepID=UPI003F9666FC